MINIILCGAGGRRKQAIIEAVQENHAFLIKAVVKHEGRVHDVVIAKEAPNYGMERGC
ncbi:MAG: hypothetical protein QME74_03080 [Candidatus Edwardsbacteria bacterium]|nr:hypothetical protein [Candidatus Edwardsbacteria bacterium]